LPAAPRQATIGDPLYNLVVVVGTIAAMAISHGIRAKDHIANTASSC